MKRFAALCVTALLASSAVGACSSSTTSDNGLGIDPNKKLSSLTTDELAKFCDWEAKLMGGYGAPKKTTTCDVGLTVSTTPPANQAECLAKLKPPPVGCAATVQNAIDCGMAMTADPCLMTTPPACVPLSDKSCSSTTTDGGVPDATPS